MAVTAAPPVTPSKAAKKRAAAAAAPAVTPTKTAKKTKAPATPADPKWSRAMSIFRKFMPGLGHDGVGLYGTLTNGTLRKMLERCDVEGRTHVDVGAADGGVLLGAMALGAKHAYGLEIGSPAYTDKFDNMMIQLSEQFPSAGEARLATSTDICDLRAATVEGWLAEVFARGGAVDDDSEITVSAVWHGFNIEAKEALLAACAASDRVVRLSLIGPAKRDFGKPESVIEFVASCGARAELVHDDLAHLSGSGENQRVMTFQLAKGRRAALF